MPTFREFLNRLRDLTNRKRLSADLDGEIKFHKAMLERDSRGKGLNDSDARQAAAKQFGNATAIREHARDAWSFRWMESVAQDARFALRTFIRAPGFTAVVLLTLTLGIGADTAVFSAVDGVLLRPLPYPHPDRLVAIWPSHFVSAAEYDYTREHSQSYGGEIAIFSPGWGSVVTQTDAATQVSGARTSVNFFRVLGAPPLIGRTFSEGESAPGAPRVVVLSWQLWSTRFGADQKALNTWVDVDGVPAQIVGVMPRDFSIFQNNAELWMPLEINPASSSYKGGTAFMIGRLKTGMTQEAAAAEIKAIAPQMRTTFAFEDSYGQDIGISSLQENIVGPIKPTVLVLFGAALCLMLIAAANVANMLVARAGARHSEIALRAALGASRVRVIRQLLVESVLLASAGGALGLAVGALGVRAIKRMLPPGIPRADAINVDMRVLAISVVVTIGIGLLFGLLPALLASRSTGVARARSAGSAALGSRVRGGLVVAEVALALVLVIGAGLMLESMWGLSHVNTGFHSDHVVTLRIQPSGAEFPTTASRMAYFDQVSSTVQAIPGVENVGAIQHLPLSGFNWHREVEIEGHPHAVGAAPFRPGYRMIFGEYLEVMKIPVVAGRPFGATDDTAHAPVALVNETFARTQFPGETAIGKRIKPERQPWLTIIGVVGDVRHQAVTAPVEPEFFVPTHQQLQTQMQLVVRTKGDPLSVTRTIYEHVANLSRAVPVSNLRTLESHTSASIATPRVVMLLMVAFALVGLSLGAIGIYGVVGYTVANRRREIGIRIALGGSRASVVAMLLRDGVVNASVGVLVGLAAAIILSRALKTIVFGVSTTDVMTYASVAAGLMGVAAAASWLPARRAVRADPMRVLREE